MGTRETETKAEGEEGDRKTMTGVETNNERRETRRGATTPKSPTGRVWRPDFGRLASLSPVLICKKETQWELQGGA